MEIHIYMLYSVRLCSHVLVRWVLSFFLGCSRYGNNKFMSILFLTSMTFMQINVRSVISVCCYVHAIYIVIVVIVIAIVLVVSHE